MQLPRYIALVEYDDAASAYGAAIPDFPGCNAMGATIGEVEANAIAALREWAIDYLDGSDELPAARTIEELRRDESLFDDFTPNTLVLPLPLFLDSARPTKANISMEAGLLAEIDEAARRRGLTRSAFLASAARDKIAAERGLILVAG
jgi:predicted RNase H-like HicB family nuclease